MLSKNDKESLKYIESKLQSNQPISQKAIDMIEEQFALYGYLKSLIEMRNQDLRL
tara:strand:+ start:4329 stop:4493 length:165 start_codon:yes stop_codon:yes gene_type:complete